MDRYATKALPFDELIKKVRKLQSEGKTVVLSMGIFDLIHPGILQHLDSAHQQGDILIVAVVKDKNAAIGPGRPLFPEEHRMLNAAALSQVDYVCLVDNDIPYECVSKIKPDVYARGKADKDHDRLVYGHDNNNANSESFGAGRVYETSGFSFSSSHIINKLSGVYPKETRDYLKAMAEKYSFEKIANNIHSLKDMNVLLIGDGIIDEYHFCDAMNRSAKTPLVVNRYLNHEVYNGGAFAIANHLSSLCNSIHLVSLVGEPDSREEFIRSNLRDNVSLRLFKRTDGPTVIKKRYINEALGWKLFEVNYINNEYIGQKLTDEVTEYIESTISDYDVVMVSDFGHGFINERIMRVIEQHAKVLAINTQTNAANAGYNLITKYKKPHFVCLDENEVRLASQQRFSDIESVARNIREEVDADYLMVTLGREGSVGVSRDGESRWTPIFSTKVVDTIGAGDAFFAYTAPCFARDLPLDMVSFIGNAVGALAVQIVGNKRPVEKAELLDFIYTILK